MPTQPIYISSASSKQLTLGVLDIMKKEGRQNHIDFPCAKKVQAFIHQTIRRLSSSEKALDPNRAIDRQASRRLRQQSRALLKAKLQSSQSSKPSTFIPRSEPGHNETRFGGPRNINQSFYAPDTNALFNNASALGYHELQQLQQASNAVSAEPYLRDRPFANGPPRDVNTSFSWSPDSASYQFVFADIKKPEESVLSQEQLKATGIAAKDFAYEKNASYTNNASIHESFAVVEEHDSGIALDDMPETKAEAAVDMTNNIEVKNSQEDVVNAKETANVKQETRNSQKGVKNSQEKVVKIKQEASNSQPAYLPTIIIIDTQESSQTTTQSSQFNASTQNTQYSDEPNPATQPEFANRKKINPKSLLRVPRNVKAPVTPSPLRRSSRISSMSSPATPTVAPVQQMSPPAPTIYLGKRSRNDGAGGARKKLKRGGGVSEVSM